MVTLEQVGKFIDALERLYKTLGVKSSGGRVMLGIETLLAIFLLLILSLMGLETVYESLYALLRGQEYVFHYSGRYFATAIAIMFASMVIVLVRELLRAQGDADWRG